MKNKKKLLIIVPHLRDGGAQKSAARLSELLCDEFEIYILTFFSQKIFPVAYTYKGEHICLEQEIKGSVFHKVQNTIQRWRFLKRIKKEKKIDLAISYMHSAHVANVLSKTNEKTFISLRTLLSKNIRSKLEGYSTRKIYHRADVVIAQNQRALDDAISNFNISSSQAVVIPNFYNFDTIETAYSATLPTKPNTTPYFICTQVGRLNEAKGQWHLLRIFKQLSEQTPQVRLLILGAGDLEQMLFEYAAELELKVQNLIDSDNKTPDLDNHQIVFLGFVANPYQYHQLTDLFLFTSIYEGFPNALAEAMICGVPVMSADCPAGPRELIAPEAKTIDNYPCETKFGILFPPFNGEVPPATATILPEEQLWITQIINYVNAPEKKLEMGEYAKERMREYDKEVVKQSYLKLM